MIIRRNEPAVLSRRPEKDLKLTFWTFIPHTSTAFWAFDSSTSHLLSTWHVLSRWLILQHAFIKWLRLSLCEGTNKYSLSKIKKCVLVTIKLHDVTFLLWSCTFPHIPSQNYNHAHSRNAVLLMETGLRCFEKQNLSYLPSTHRKLRVRLLFPLSYVQRSIAGKPAAERIFFSFTMMQRHSFTPLDLLLLPHRAQPAENCSSTSKSWILLRPCNIQWPLDCANSQLPLSKSWSPAAYCWSLLIYLRKKLGLPGVFFF